MVKDQALVGRPLETQVYDEVVESDQRIVGRLMNEDGEGGR